MISSIMSGRMGLRSGNLLATRPPHFMYANTYQKRRRREYEQAWRMVVQEETD